MTGYRNTVDDRVWGHGDLEPPPAPFFDFERSKTEVGHSADITLREQTC
jgi:hypothetical protein